MEEAIVMLEHCATDAPFPVPREEMPAYAGEY